MTMQQLQAVVTIPIPDGMVLVEKTYLKQTEAAADSGRYWSMKQLQEYTSKSYSWLTDNILEVPKYKRIMDIMVNPTNGFVSYPYGGKSGYSFKAGPMKEFLDLHFSEIFRNVRKDH